VKLLNQAEAVTESVDGPAQPNFVIDDGKVALLTKVMKDTGAWVTVQMVMLLPETETVAALQFQRTPIQHLLQPQSLTLQYVMAASAVDLPSLIAKK